MQFSESYSEIKVGHGVYHYNKETKYTYVFGEQREVIFMLPYQATEKEVYAGIIGYNNGVEDEKARTACTK